MDPTHPHGQLETATAPSAGGSPGPDGERRARSCVASRPWLPIRPIIVEIEIEIEIGINPCPGWRLALIPPKLPCRVASAPQ